MDTFSSEVSGIAATIIALSIIGAVALVIILAGLTAGVITGGAVGVGFLGYRAYKKRQLLGPYDERGDASGTGLYDRGGLFVGQEDRWE